MKKLYKLKANFADIDKFLQTLNLDKKNNHINDLVNLVIFEILCNATEHGVCCISKAQLYKQNLSYIKLLRQKRILQVESRFNTRGIYLNITYAKHIQNYNNQIMALPKQANGQDSNKICGGYGRAIINLAPVRLKVFKNAFYITEKWQILYRF